MRKCSPLVGTPLGSEAAIGHSAIRMTTTRRIARLIQGRCRRALLRLAARSRHPEMTVQRKGRCLFTAALVTSAPVQILFSNNEPD